MASSQPVTIVREVRRVFAPASIRCALCKLYAGDDETPPSVHQIGIKYNGDGLMPENPLVALNRHRYICDDCIDAIKESSNATP